jgi:hypothetical protein
MHFSPKLALRLGSIFLFAAGALAVDPATQLVTEARAAYQRGEVEAAKAKLQSANSIDPKNPAALALLKQIQAREAAQGGTGERGLARLILPTVQFRDAEFGAVLDALRQQAEKLSGGKLPVNFVVQLPEAQAKTAITLSLSNVPFTEVLKYIGSLANVTFIYDKYAIMVRPAGAATTTGEAPKTEEAPKVKGL